MVLAPGTQINEYRILRLLGKGGMGEVYLAEDVKLGREVAVKILPREFVSDPNRRKRFEQEAKAASRLNHANSAHVYSFGEWEGGAFLAIEYVEGETLTARLQGGPLIWEEVARIGAQVADVLQAAHEKGIVHRDVKSQNIMLTKQGGVKLLDFGLAKLEQKVAPGEEAETAQMITNAGAVVGSMGYMSPEQALGKAVDARSDLFSLGVVLYEMAAARRPFSGTNGTEVLSKILTGTPDALSRWNYATPGEMERIILKCLEKAPEDRYQSAREVEIDLRAWLRANSSKATATRTGEKVELPEVPAPGVSRRKWTLVAGSVAGGLAVVGVAGYGVYRWMERPAPEPLAVLPFTHGGGPEEDLLSDGLTEALIDRIASVGSLAVIARSAVFRLKKLDDPIAAVRPLNAVEVLVGRLKAFAGTVQVSMELVEVGTSKQIWSQQVTAERSQFQTLPGRIAELVLQALGVRRRKTLSTRKAVDGEAYNNYLRARQAINRRVPDAFGKALEFYRKALDIDPAYAAAYAGMADAYSLQSGQLPPNEVCPKAKAAALKALELDAGLSDGYAALGFVQMHYDYAWGESEASYQRALAINASYPPAHSYYARLLTALKRFQEAEAQQKLAIQLDPLTPALSTALGFTFYHARRFRDAEIQLQKVLSDQPRFIQAKSMLGTVRNALGNAKEAIPEFEKCLEIMGEDDYGILADLGISYLQLGNREKAQEMMGRITKMQVKEYVPPSFVAPLVIALGDKARGIDMLETGADPDHGWNVYYYGVEPKLDAVRGEPRFQKLLARLKLPT